jgi:hypothetical protein
MILYLFFASFISSTNRVVCVVSVCGVCGAVQREPLSKRQAKRNAFVLCVLHRSINAAAVDYKKRMCTEEDTINYDKVVNVQNNEHW